MRLDRHQIVRVDPAKWREALAAHSDLATEAEIRDWAALGRPLIARRPVCSDGGALVPLGLPLPPAMGKRRLAFQLPFEAVIASEEPPFLSDARRVAPAEWHPVIAKLIVVDAKVRCFGSLAWEFLTGLPYLSESSDLDLLWRIDGASNADALVDEIARIEAYAPMRIDGELVAPSGLAVQWREWRSGASEILVKDWALNRLLAREEMFG